MVRLPIERFTWMSLDTVNDLINSITAASSDLKRKGHLIDMIMEALGLSKHKLTDEMPSNSQYAGQQRWFYHLCNIGSSFGLHNYYVNMPKALGGGGAKPLMRKAYFYYDKLPFGNYIYDRGKKTDKVDKRKRMSEFLLLAMIVMMDLIDDENITIVFWSYFSGTRIL